MTNASELLEGLFREAHEADEGNQMMDCNPRAIICAQTELRHFEAQVTQLEAQLAEMRGVVAAWDCNQLSDLDAMIRVSTLLAKEPKS